MRSLKNICVGSDVTQACSGWGAIRQIVSILRPDPELVGVNDAGFVRINISEWATGKTGLCRAPVGISVSRQLINRVISICAGYVNHVC